MINPMTADEISSFVHRLLRRELTKEELSAITTRDLSDINTYLAEYARTFESAINATTRTEPKRTYTEDEILAELGLLEA
jgi:hypothetical protein